MSRRPLARAMRALPWVEIAPTFAAAGLALAVLALLVFPSAAPALEQRLVADDGATGDQLGAAVALDGDTAVVGAPGDDGHRGAVYVFVRSGNRWNQVAKLTASDREEFDQLGTSVAIDGEAIVAGAPGDDGDGTSGEGSAYVFSRTGGDRNEEAKLTAFGGAANNQLGASVAIDGNTIVAGAPQAGPGTVHVFTATAGAWAETAALTASDGELSDRLGASVAIDGETIVAGAPNRGDSFEGAAYTFARTGPASREESAILTAADGGSGDQLGASVAIDGETIVAGAPEGGGGADSGGAVYAFAASGPDRTEIAKLTASDGVASDSLGASVAIEPGAIAGGAHGAGGRGAAYVFAGTGGDRNEVAVLTPSDSADGDGFGSSVAIDAGTLLAGAVGDAVGPNAEQGSATIFFPPAPAPPQGENGDRGTPPPIDEIAPTLELAAARQLLRRTVTIEVGCDEPCQVAARGRLIARRERSRRRSGPRSHRVGRAKRRALTLTPDSASVAAGERVRLQLRLTRRRFRRARRAARRGTRLVVQLAVTATDPAGNEARRRATLRLRRR